MHQLAVVETALQGWENAAERRMRQKLAESAARPVGLAQQKMLIGSA